MDHSCALNDHRFILVSNGTRKPANGWARRPFRVEFWDDHDRHIEEVIALVSDYATARSAYDEAVRRRPGKLITLRQKARVIQKSR